MSFYSMITKRGGGTPAAYDWTARTSNFAGNIRSLVRDGGSYWVLVGLSSDLATSTDGTTWTKRTNIPYISDGRAVAYGDGKYVVGGSAGKMSYCTDPTNNSWIEQTAARTGFSTSLIFGIAYGNSTIRYIAVGQSGKLARSHCSGLSVWNDWHIETTPTSQTINDVAMGSSYMVYVANSGEAGRSSNGTSWSSVSLGMSSSAAYGIAYGNSYFVVVGLNGKISTSSNDGSSWTLNTSSTVGAGVGFFKVAYDSTAERWCAVGWSGAVYATSGSDPTGVWSVQTMDGFGTNQCYDVGFGDGYLVAVANASYLNTSFS